MPSPHSSSTGPVSSDASVESRVRSSLLTVVYNDQPLSLLAAGTFAFVMVVVLEYHRHGATAWLWLAAMLTVLTVRGWHLGSFRRSIKGSEGDIVRWARLLWFGSTATAVLWGYMGWYGYAFETSVARVALFILLGGVVAASSRTLACHAPTFFTYVTVSTTPLLCRMLMSNSGEAVIIFAFATLYVGLMIALGLSFRLLMTRSFRLQFENADLAARLQRDVAALAAAERALQESETRLKVAQYGLDHANDLVAVVDRAGSFLYVNETFCRYAGRGADELAGMKAWENVFATGATGFLARWDDIKRARSLTFESLILRKDQTRFPVEVNASYVQLPGREVVCTIARDLSARQAADAEKARLQQQLQETQRLESLGVLAGGVAHDFNNLLTAILGNASLARDTLSDPKAAKDMLGQIEVAANQAAGLCRQMLAYAGHGQLRIEPLNLSTIVLESAKLLEMTIAHRARLELQLAPALPGIRADASQLRQVVLNLVHNAAEAIERANGAIIVTTMGVYVDQAMIASARVRSDIQPGPGVSLVVTDNGSGMTAETLDRIFEPFFTTKFTGRGLGLPAVLGIVRSHRGLLHVESKPGAGSAFRVTFSAEPAIVGPTTAPGPVASAAAGGCALVVEDEEPVRRVAQQVLLRMGYEVDMATDGASAVTRVARDATRYKVVVMDMTMPRMDGAVTLQQMRKLGMHAPCILMSGLSEQQVRPRVDGVPRVSFLQKPFDVSTLTSAVRDAVGAAEK